MNIELLPQALDTRREEIIDTLKAHASGGTLTESVANRLVGALIEIDHLPGMIEDLKAENAKKINERDEIS